MIFIRKQLYEVKVQKPQMKFVALQFYLQINESVPDFFSWIITFSFLILEVLITD